VPARVHGAHEVSAGVEPVWEAMTGERWPAALDAALHDGSALLERTATPDGGVRLVTRRRLPESVPPLLQRFVPTGGAVTQTDEWGPARDGLRSGTWTVDVAGVPGSLGGVLRVEPAPGGARWVVDGTVAVRVPLVGGRVEAYLAPLVGELVARQAQVLRELLG
jgi:Protein of unknown function (DUF2505)